MIYENCQGVQISSAPEEMESVPSVHREGEESQFESHKIVVPDTTAPFPYVEEKIHYQERPIVVKALETDENTQGETTSSITDPTIFKYEKPPRHTICGIKRQTFLTALVILLVFVAALAGGLTGGIVSRQKKVEAAPATAAAITAQAPQTTSLASRNDAASSASTSRSNAASKTSTSKLPTSTGPGGVAVECPAANGTIYTSGEKQFLRLCTSEHPPEDGSVDITGVKAQSMDECIEACASYNGQKGKCVGVNWIYRKPQGTDNSYCWMKNHIGGVRDWDGCEAAILVNMK